MLVLLSHSSLHDIAHGWTGSFCQYHHQGFGIYDVAGTTPGHGSRSLHYRRTVQFRVASEENGPEHFGHGIILHPVSVLREYTHTHIQKSNLRLTDNTSSFRSFAGTIVLMTVENTSTATEAGLLFSYYIVLSFWAAQGLGMSLLSRNVAGQTKKSVAVTMNFVAWAAGNAIGKFCSFFSSYLHPEFRKEEKKRNKLTKLPPLKLFRSPSLPLLGFPSVLHRLRHSFRLLHIINSHPHRLAHYSDAAQCQTRPDCQRGSFRGQG